MAFKTFQTLIIANNAVTKIKLARNERSNFNHKNITIKGHLFWLGLIVLTKSLYIQDSKEN